MNALEQFQASIGTHFSESPSAFMRWLNPIILEAEAGRLVFQYIVRPEWLNPIQNLHGGVTAAIMDDIIGATTFTFGEDAFYSTINNTIDYFAAVQAGALLIAETRILKKGAQFVHAECEIWNADRSRLIARGTSNLFKNVLKK